MITRKTTENIGLKDRKSLNLNRAVLKNMVVAIFAATIASTAAAEVVASKQAVNDNWVNGTSARAWTNGSDDLCWRNGFWTPATANSKCDGALVAQLPTPPIPAPVVPVPAPKIESKEFTYSADALFDFDKAVLKAEGKSELDELFAKLNSVNVERIVVAGHTDYIGTERYNQKLSEQRALAVSKYLESKGVAAERLSIEARGKKDSPSDKTIDCKSLHKYSLNKSSLSRKKLIECLTPDRKVVVEVIGTETVKTEQ